MDRIEVYSTLTPINFVMDIPSEVRSSAEQNLDLNRLYLEAVNYGRQKRTGKSLAKGQPGESIKTTLSTKRYDVRAENLVGFKRKVQLLPGAYSDAQRRANVEAGIDEPAGVIEAEKAISEFKIYAKRRLEKAVADGVRGYDNCIAVIKDINRKAVRGITKLEFFMKRVSDSEFEGAHLAKDGLWYRTDKVRKFYSSTQPTVGLIESIIRDSLLSSEAVIYNETFVFKSMTKLDGSLDRRRSGNPHVIQMVRQGFDAPESRSSPEDRQVADLLQQMRRPGALG